MSSRKTLILINPTSGRVQTAWLKIKKALRQNGVAYDVEETTLRGQAETLTRDALKAGYQTIAVVGGDGTLSESARGFFDVSDQSDSLPRQINSTSALAILPAGTGNDFARGLTAGRAPLHTWTKRLVVHFQQPVNDLTTTRLVDTIYAEVTGTPKNFLCLNAATMGVSADVARRVSLHGAVKRKLPGEVRFALEAIRALKSWCNYGVRLIVDGENINCNTGLIVLANGVFVGGGMKVAPDAQPDDGKLDALTVCDLSRLQAVREFSRLHRGGHVGSRKLMRLSASHVKIQTVEGAPPFPIEADGDVRGHTPAEFRVIPRSLRVVW